MCGVYLEHAAFRDGTLTKMCTVRISFSHLRLHRKSLLLRCYFFLFSCYIQNHPAAAPCYIQPNDTVITWGRDPPRSTLPPCQVLQV